MLVHQAPSCMYKSVFEIWDKRNSISAGHALDVYVALYCTLYNVSSCVYDDIQNSNGRMDGICTNSTTLLSVHQNAVC